MINGNTVMDITQYKADENDNVYDHHWQSKAKYVWGTVFTKHSPGPYRLILPSNRPSTDQLVADYGPAMGDVIDGFLDQNSAVVLLPGDPNISPWSILLNTNDWVTLASIAIHYNVVAASYDIPAWD